MALVSTGQITIVDNNDARPLTAFIGITPAAQQIYTKDESSVTFTPDWTTANTNTGVELRAIVYAGKTGASEDVTTQLTNRKFAYSVGGAALASGATDTNYWNESSATVSAIGYQTVVADGAGYRLRVRANLKPSVIAPLNIYFEGDYTDPVTSLVSKVVASITLTQVRTGTNSVFINLRMPDGYVLEPDNPASVENGAAGPKKSVRVYADLIRAAGVDDTGVTYKWFESPHAAANQIDGNLASVTTKYGLLDTAAVGASRAVTTGQYATGALSVTAGITTTNVPDGTYGDYKGLSVSATAVADLGVYKVEARDSDGTVYQTFFTIYDISDPYEIRLNSSGGDKLQNGVGSTNVSPEVFYGQDRVSNCTGWTFTWQYFDNAAQRGAFVDTTRTAVAGGRSITSNTTNSFTHDGAPITFAQGDIIKAVLGAKAELFEVLSVAGNVVTVRSPITNTWLPAANFTGLTLNEFQNGKLYVMLGERTTSGVNAVLPATQTAIALTGDDIDAKGTVVCSADKP